MTDQEILAKFTRILRDLLLDDSIELTMETRREDVPNWDSFNYINFIVAVEMEFGVKFKVADIVPPVDASFARSRPGSRSPRAMLLDAGADCGTVPICADNVGAIVRETTKMLA